MDFLTIPQAELEAPEPPKRPERGPRKPLTDKDADRGRKYALAGLRREADELASMPTSSGRNNKVRDAAYSIAGYIEEGHVTAQEIEDELMKAAQQCGLVNDDGEEKTLDTLRRAIAAGELEPRPIPEPKHQPRGSIRTTPAGANPPAAGDDDDDDDDHSISFEDLMTAAQSATMDTLPRVLQDLRYLADSGTRNSQREAIFKALKEATGAGITALKRDYAAMLPDQEQPERETLAQQLLNIVLDAGVTLWRDPDGEPYITLALENHREHHRLKTQAVKRWIQRLWYEETGGTIGREPLSEALGVLEGKAIHDGEEHETFIRVAETGHGTETHIYIDMGDPYWHAIEVTAEGWRVIDAASTPVRFIRSGGMLALPTPEPGSVPDIAAALGIPHMSEDGTTPNRAFQGAIAWLLQAFRVNGPFPVLPLFGQQGAGKTTFTKRLCWLLDPHSATLRVLSRDDRDILIAARHSWLQAKDNVSTLTQWTSDAFCRLATGGAISTRTLYTDDEETILNAKRPLLLNGITNFLEQQDLVDRSIVVSLTAISEADRRPESELEQRYAELQPKAIGALLTIVSAGIARSGERHLARLPRMADFAEWIVACSPALGWDAEEFLNWYASTKTDLVKEALDASPIVPYLLQLMAKHQDEVELAPSELLAELNHLAGLDEGKKRAPHGWPKRAQSLTNELKRLQPALLSAEGIEIEQARDKSTRTWRLRRVEKSSSPSSPAPWTLEKARAARENTDDDETRAHRHPSSSIVTDDDPVTMTPEASSPQEARSQRHNDEGDDDDDEITTLRVGAVEKTNGATTPPEVRRLHTLWRAGKRWPPEEQEDLDRIFNQPKATADDQRRLLDIAARLNTTPPGAPV